MSSVSNSALQAPSDGLPKGPTQAHSLKLDLLALPCPRGDTSGKGTSCSPLGSHSPLSSPRSGTPRGIEVLSQWLGDMLSVLGQARQRIKELHEALLAGGMSPNTAARKVSMPARVMMHVPDAPLMHVPDAPLMHP